MRLSMKTLGTRYWLAAVVALGVFSFQGCYTRLATVSDEDERVSGSETAYDSTSSGQDYDVVHRWRDSYHVGFEFYNPPAYAYWDYDPWMSPYYDPWWCGSAIVVWRNPYPYYGYYPRYAYFNYPHSYYSYPYYYPAYTGRTYTTRNSGVRRTTSTDRTTWTGRGGSGGGSSLPATSVGTRTEGMGRTTGTAQTGTIGTGAGRTVRTNPANSGTNTRVATPRTGTRGSAVGRSSGRSNAGSRRSGSVRPNGGASAPRSSPAPTRSSSPPSGGGGGGRSGGGSGSSGGHGRTR
jgi:hypothetical protein